MKPSVILTFLLSFGLVACGPSKYIMDLEMRQTSISGVDLLSKNVSIVYLESEDDDKTKFSEGMAEGFAQALEKEYGLNSGEVGIFHMPTKSGSNYSSRDTLFNILMDTGSDVVFMIDTLEFGKLVIGNPAKVSGSVTADSSYISSCNLPFRMKLHSYDAMDKEDKVKTFAGSTVANPILYSDGKVSNEILTNQMASAMYKEGINAGKKLSVSFCSQWKTEQFSLLYFNSEQWYKALEKAESFDWKAAMDIWIGFLESSDPLKSSSAAYNLSIACHILGNNQLANEWLDRSDAINQLPLSETLRKRLK